jgi:hypothetical protein
MYTGAIKNINLRNPGATTRQKPTRVQGFILPSSSPVEDSVFSWGFENLDDDLGLEGSEHTFPSDDDVVQTLRSENDALKRRVSLLETQLQQLQQFLPK